MIFTFNMDYGRRPIPGENVKKPAYKDYKVKAIGVLEEGNWETDWSIYAPLEVVQKLIKEKEKAENSKQERGRRKERIVDLKPLV